ncbi:MAG: hypothetical protein JXB10_03780 [Pirellulales bacterium]|nr:hypothetical protein [Pirellulales bacterium]
MKVETVVILAALGGVAVLLLLFSWIMHRRQRGYRPGELFLSLCRAHRLGWKQCWWLWQLARQQQLTDPGRLFLEPERFEASRIPVALLPRKRHLQELRERLFRMPPRKTPPETARPPLGAPPTLNVPPWTPAETLPPLPSNETLESV